MSEEVSRLYTIPLGRVDEVPRYKRAAKAMRVIREFVRKHMKTEEVKIAPEVSEQIWKRGIENPPRRVTVNVEKDKDGVATVSLAK